MRCGGGVIESGFFNFSIERIYSHTKKQQARVHGARGTTLYHLFTDVPRCTDTQTLIHINLPSFVVLHIFTKGPKVISIPVPGVVLLCIHRSG